MRESSLWHWLFRAHELYGRRLHMTRVEDVTSVGRPDVEGCMDSRCFVMELKVANRPARPTTPIRTQSPVKPEQIAWLANRWDAGGNAFILIQVGQGPEARRYLLEAPDAAAVAQGLTEDELRARSLLDPREPASRIVAMAAAYKRPRPR